MYVKRKTEGRNVLLQTPHHLLPDCTADWWCFQFRPFGGIPCIAVTIETAIIKKEKLMLPVMLDWAGRGSGNSYSITRSFWIVFMVGVFKDFFYIFASSVYIILNRKVLYSSFYVLCTLMNLNGRDWFLFWVENVVSIFVF